ncbi:hypothetical protein FGO68_gene7602 [Halteria grandinella]|uniref:Uncharacterized protein n=1 Tax=Halteria grandinella TaxID=5974 RepID=A0A8J8P647_HALGN|nr:hypothetical protein FGO68_gene7602 [Halteria grandinella]
MFFIFTSAGVWGLIRSKSSKWGGFWRASLAALSLARLASTDSTVLVSSCCQAITPYVYYMGGITASCQCQNTSLQCYSCLISGSLRVRGLLILQSAIWRAEGKSQESSAFDSSLSEGWDSRQEVESQSDLMWVPFFCNESDKSWPPWVKAEGLSQAQSDESLLKECLKCENSSTSFQEVDLSPAPLSVESSASGRPAQYSLALSLALCSILWLRAAVQIDLQVTCSRASARMGDSLSLRLASSACLRLSSSSICSYSSLCFRSSSSTMLICMANAISSSVIAVGCAPCLFSYRLLSLFSSSSCCLSRSLLSSSALACISLSSLAVCSFNMLFISSMKDVNTAKSSTANMYLRLSNMFRLESISKFSSATNSARAWKRWSLVARFLRERRVEERISLMSFLQSVQILSLSCKSF